MLSLQVPEATRPSGSSRLRAILGGALLLSVLGLSTLPTPRDTALLAGAAARSVRTAAASGGASAASSNAGAAADAAAEFDFASLPPCILERLQRAELPPFARSDGEEMSGGFGGSRAVVADNTAELPVYVVSFAGAAQRQVQMAAALRRQGLNGAARLIASFDWPALSRADVACFYNNFTGLALWPGQSPLKPGQISNSIKHVAVAYDVVRTGTAAAIVLEDDAVLSTTFAQTATLALRTVPDGWDAVYMSECCVACTAATKGGVQVTPRLWRAPMGRCADARLLSQRGARKHLRSLPLRHVFDWHVDTVPGMEFYWLEPFEAWQNSSNFPSTIQNGMGVNKR